VSSVAAPAARLLSLLSAISPFILPESKAKVFYTLLARKSLADPRAVASGCAPAAEARTKSTRPARYRSRFCSAAVVIFFHLTQTLRPRDVSQHASAAIFLRGGDGTHLAEARAWAVKS
jgi:hypothetical protein